MRSVEHENQTNKICQRKGSKFLLVHRKEKFSEELRILTAEVTQHEIELFGKASANISYATKEAIWSSIVEKVNAVGVTRRTVNQLMKR